MKFLSLLRRTRCRKIYRDVMQCNRLAKLANLALLNSKTISTKVKVDSKRLLDRYFSMKSQNIGYSTGADYRTRFISDFIKQTGVSGVVTEEDWQSFAVEWNEQFVTGGVKRQGSWESMAMNTLFRFQVQQTESAKNLIRYIRNENRSPNISTLTTYISILGESGENEKLLFEVYDELLKYTDVFDYASCRQLIIGFSHTSRWKKCLEFLDMSTLIENRVAGRNLHSQIVWAAFKNCEFELGFNLLNDMQSKNLIPFDDVFSQYLKLCDGKAVTIEPILEFMRKLSYFPSSDVIKQIENHFHRIKTYGTSYTSVSNRGICNSCGQHLQQNELTEDEFTQLRDIFLRDSFVTENPYIKSSPTEVAKFRDFLDRTGPYEIVVDGLNVAILNFRAPTNARSQALLDMVERLCSRDGKKILVLGRKHMLKWPRISKVTNATSCFFTEDDSADDPFMLYATLHSGRAAMFVSRDEMGDHRHVLNNDLYKVFKKWQRSRQIYHGTSQATGRVTLKYPKPYDTLVQRHPSGWHIPYMTDVRLVSYQHPDTWLCVHQI